MRKILVLLLATTLFSCKKDKLGQNKDNDPVPSTLEMTYDFAPLATYREIKFWYTDINGNDIMVTDPEGNKVTNVDFSQYVKVTARAWNFQGNTLVSWYLKKDGVLIDAHSVTQYTYENQ